MCPYARSWGEQLKTHEDRNLQVQIHPANGLRNSCSDSVRWLLRKLRALGMVSTVFGFHVSGALVSGVTSGRFNFAWDHVAKLR